METTSFCTPSYGSVDASSATSSVDAPIEETLVTLTGLEGCKIKASKTVLASCNELIADAIDEQKHLPAVNLGDYSMRSLLGLVEFCQHNELSEACGVKTKSSAIGLSDLHQIAQDYMFHALTRYVYELASDMVNEVPSLGCVFLKRQKPGSSLYRMGLKAMSMSPKEALEDADDDLLKKLNRDRLKEVIKAVEWKEYSPELLPHILVKWICAHGGLPVKVEIARMHTKHMQLPSLEERIYEACKCVGMSITDQDVALVGLKGCRIFTNRAMISAANDCLKDLLASHPDDRNIQLGDYTMRSILGLVEFCQHGDVSLTLGEKKKTAAIALAELSQMAEDYMFTELSDFVYRTCSSMIKTDKWLAFVMLKRTEPGSPLFKLGLKTFRLFPKEVLDKADDELLKKLNRDRLALVVNQVDWTQKDHDLLPHVLSNWICAWDGLPIKIEIARGLMKKARIDIDCLPSLVLDAGRMTGLIDYASKSASSALDISLVGHAHCRVRVVKSIIGSRNAQLKELLYKDPTASSVFIGDYSKRAIVALAEYCHNDHFMQTLGTKDETSAHGLVELSELASSFMFEDLVTDVYQACVRLVEEVPSMALILFRRCSPSSALNKLALKTFRLKLKESILMAPITLQKLLDDSRMTLLVEQMRWKEEPQMLIMVLVEWVKMWDIAPEKVNHAREIASDIELKELPEDTLLLFQKTGLVNPAKVQAVIKARDNGEDPPSKPTFDPFDCNVTTSSMVTMPTATSSSGSASNTQQSWVGRSIVGDGDISVVSTLEAECAWVTDSKTDK
uniref:BTB domain-containing protein n=1 Tax=Grammatophora oceanica TaxID=210454 RepID=A0A7S1USD4_9STRA|mmetsp:Transcript_16397/g.24276  ORF Transcript_16397/g.24276 Transcript_16397/m.24276 type:complete len:791 (+) Transcript_16397:129-2501(+)